MGTTLKAGFTTRREAEMTIERLVQEYGVERTAITAAAQEENSVGEAQAGSDTEVGQPSPEDRNGAALAGKIALSVDIDDADHAGKVRAAFHEFGAEDIVKG